MARSKRLTRQYRIGSDVYGPNTPSKDVPEKLWEREKQLATPEEQLKIARRYGTAASFTPANLVPESQAEELPTASETAPLPPDVDPDEDSDEESEVE